MLSLLTLPQILLRRCNCFQDLKYQLDLLTKQSVLLKCIPLITGTFCGGSSNPGAVKFSNVTATSLNLSTDILQVVKVVWVQIHSIEDILVASDSTVISKLSSGKDGQFCQADSKEPYGMKWVDSPAPPQTSESITGATNTEALNSTVNKSVSTI